jgi:hypothetical protein
MRVCVGLIMLAVLSPGFLVSYWSTGVWDISSGIGPCLPLAGGLCKFYANAGGKRPIQRSQIHRETVPLRILNMNIMYLCPHFFLSVWSMTKRCHLFELTLEKRKVRSFNESTNLWNAKLGRPHCGFSLAAQIFHSDIYTTLNGAVTLRWIPKLKRQKTYMVLWAFLS